METDQGGPTVFDPGFFNGRYLIEIERWDWNLHVALSPDATPPGQRFQGGLMYGRGLEIEGRILAPPPNRGQAIRVWTSNIGPEIDFTPQGQDDVGRLYNHRNKPGHRAYAATLLLPQDALPMAITCLASIWKYIHIWTVGEHNDEVQVTGFAFSADVHENLQPWVSSGEVP
jgi:hypothetical protein